MVERRGTKALELWCKRVTDGYPHVKIENMTSSWRDGMAFCALIHHFRPDLIEYSSLNPSDVYGNNELAFRTAERHLGIPALLDASDMLQYEVPDRLSILTYLSQFYQVFGSQGSSPTKRTAPDIPESERQSLLLPSAPPAPSKLSNAGSCRACGCPVYLTQRLLIDKRLYHRACFRCARCNAQLSPSNCYETEYEAYCCETCPDEETDFSTPAKRFDNIMPRDPLSPASENVSLPSQPSDLNLNANINVEDNNNLDINRLNLVDDNNYLEKDRALISSNVENSLVNSRRILFERMSDLTDDAKVKSLAEKGRSKRSPVKLDSDNNNYANSSNEDEIIRDKTETCEDRVSISHSAPKSDDFIKERSSESSDFEERLSFFEEGSVGSRHSYADSNLFSRSRSSSSRSLRNFDVKKIDKKIVPDFGNSKINPEKTDEKIVSDIGSSQDNSEKPCLNVFNVYSDIPIEDTLTSKSNDKSIDGTEFIKENVNTSISDGTPIAPIDIKHIPGTSIDEIIYDKEFCDTSNENCTPFSEVSHASNQENKIHFEPALDNKNDKPFDNENDISLVETNDDLVDKTNKKFLEERSAKSLEEIYDESNHIASDKHRGEINNKHLSETNEESPYETNEKFPDKTHDRPIEKINENPFDITNKNFLEKTNDQTIEKTNKKLLDKSYAEHLDKTINNKPLDKTEGISRSDDYPEELNPFGDDEDADAMVFQTSATISTNPFDDCDDDDDVYDKCDENNATEIKNNSLNPFGSDEESDNLSSLNESVELNKLSPMNNSGRSLTPKSYSRKKKPAPSPPIPPLTSPKSSMEQPMSPATSDIQKPKYEIHKSTHGQWKRKKGRAPEKPVAERRPVVLRIPLEQLKQELADIEIKQQELERQGVKLEQIIREKQQSGSTDPILEEMVLQLFELVNEKNEMFRRHSELMYLRKQQNLEEEHAELEYQIRCLMLTPNHSKTDSDKAREEELIKRLVEVVNKKNEIINCMDKDRMRETAEDASVGTQLDNSDSVAIASSSSSPTTSMRSSDCFKNKPKLHSGNHKSPSKSLKQKFATLKKSAKKFQK